MWILFGSAFLGLGYAIVISVQREYSMKSACSPLGEMTLWEVGKCRACVKGSGLEPVTFLSLHELRCIIEDFPDLLVLEVHESFEASPEPVVLSKALGLSLCRLREVLAWVPPNEHVVLYGVGVPAEKIIRPAPPFAHQMQLTHVRGDSDVGEQLMSRSTESPSDAFTIHDRRPGRASRSSK